MSGTCYSYFPRFAYGLYIPYGVNQKFGYTAFSSSWAVESLISNSTSSCSFTIDRAKVDWLIDQSFLFTIQPPGIAQNFRAIVCARPTAPPRFWWQRPSPFSGIDIMQLFLSILLRPTPYHACNCLCSSRQSTSCNMRTTHKSEMFRAPYLPPVTQKGFL